MNDFRERKPVQWMDDVRVPTERERLLERFFAATLVIGSVGLVIAMACAG